MGSCICVITRLLTGLGNTTGHLKGHMPLFIEFSSPQALAMTPLELALIKMGLQSRAGARSLRGGGLSSDLKPVAELQSMQIQILVQGVRLHWRRPLQGEGTTLNSRLPPPALPMGNPAYLGH